MSQMVTIKVTRQVRDRLADRAKKKHISMGAVIERALVESEDNAFWESVRKDHANLSRSEREQYRDSPGTIDNLDDPADDALSESDGW